MSDQREKSEQENQTQAMFGRVVNVRNVGSRQVTQIIIEIPDEFHVQATSLLYNRDAFVLATDGRPGPGSYGLVRLNGGEPTPPPAESHPAERAGTKYNGLNIDVDPIKWLGVQCTTVAFMQWIGADSESDAVNKVRGICQVNSRREISINAHARNRFIEKIYLPFQSHQRHVAC